MNDQNRHLPQPHAPTGRPPRTPAKSTPETVAIRTIGRVLDQLEEPTRARVMAAIRALYFPG